MTSLPEIEFKGIRQFEKYLSVVIKITPIFDLWSLFVLLSKGEFIEKTELRRHSTLKIKCSSEQFYTVLLMDVINILL